jgi:hypothetical protein
MQISDELLVGILGLSIAAVPWAFSIHAKVAVIAESVRVFPEIVHELRQRVDRHERQLQQHETQLKTLRPATETGN